jgi:TRAP-type C4-dicarboxylate transport system substrate-binding protein
MGIQRKEDVMKKAERVRVVLLGVVLMCGVTVGMHEVAAQEKPIELTYASPYAPIHPFSLADQHFFAKIDKETKGRVKFKPYWAGTLISGRESIRELSKGVADVAFITPIYEKSGVDITKAMTDFFRGSAPEVNVKIYWELYNKFPELRREFESVKLIAAHAGTPMRLMTTKKPVRTLTDLRGMRIRATGDVIVRTLKELSTEPVVMPVTEMYESLQKGIIQGVIFAQGDYKSLKLAEIVKYETENFQMDRGPYGSRAMNLDSWKKLPPDIQQIFDANREYWSLESLNESKKPDEEGRALAVKSGIQFGQMDAAGIQKYDSTFDAEALKEAKMLDGKGLPGTKFFEETRRLIKQYNTTK